LKRDGPALLWFRQDLRLGDNQALTAAVTSGQTVIPIFIDSFTEEAPWAPGAASRWWLHHSLKALNASLQGIGSQLILRRGPARDVLEQVIKETGASAVLWNRRYEPAVVARDQALKLALRSAGVHAKSFGGAVLHEPWAVQNNAGQPFKVFTPFWKACMRRPLPNTPLPRPRAGAFAPPAVWPKSLSLNDLKLLPEIDWAAGMRASWQPGELGAAQLLDRFAEEETLARYKEDRNRPDIAGGTSRLSPHLHWGEISPRQILHMVQMLPPSSGADHFRSEIGWREFAHQLLYHFPHTVDTPLRAEFAAFPWADDRIALRAWQQGRTGYPYIDAGMRELWHTGWMHNRVRMAAASFLVKDLLLPWQSGAAWFWDTLVDADLASNTLGWQWIAGCGADAAPYFRIFNPVLQGTKFDPDGAYVRRWIPELANLPAEFIHRPWTAPAGIVQKAGVILGQTYPWPIISHDAARGRALAALATIRRT